MGFADFYFSKYTSTPALIQEEPAPDLNMVVTIPCFNEQYTIKALEGLYCCLPTHKPVEVIILVNYPQNQEEQYNAIHTEIYESLVQWAANHNSPTLKFYPLLIPLPGKHAGVGFARKIAMDEALRRFNYIENSHGVIIGYDADCFCAENYLLEIENLFVKQPNVIGCSINFEHPLAGDEYPPEIYNAIIQYELYLRYYIEGLRIAHFPFAFHTLGSSFAVKAKAYAMQGGMNKRKAGEDFYFLHKIIPLGNYVELNNTRVIPSPRTSDRVPFGTGAAVTKIIESNQSQYLTFNPKIFDELRTFFDGFDSLFKTHYSSIENWLNTIHPSLKRFLLQNNFKDVIEEINANCSKIDTFNKRIFTWFNGLLVLQYLNEAHVSDFEKIPITSASKKLLNIHEDIDPIALLKLFRTHQRGKIS
jgi:hypothetical protein